MDNSQDLKKTKLIYNYFNSSINNNRYIYSFYYTVNL